MIANISNILKNPLWRNTLKLSSSSVLMYFVPLVVTPILSRIYDQSAFGEWGVFSSTVTIIGIGIFAGYENAIILSKNDVETRQLCFLNILISLSFIFLLIILFWIGKYTDLSYFESFPSLTIFGIYLVFFALLGILQNLSNLNENYAVMTFGNVIQGSAQAIFRILFGFLILPWNTNGLILGTTIAIIITTTYYIYQLKSKLRSIISNMPNILEIKTTLIRHRYFPLYDAPAQLLSFAAFNLPLIILSLYFSMADIGCYSMILQLLLIPMSFIGSAMGKVYYKQISVAPKYGEDIKRLTIQSLRLTSYISILPLLFIALGGDYILVAFLGAKWHMAGNIALCLAIWSFPTVLTQPMLSIFRVYSRQSYLLVNNLVYFTLGITSIIITASIFHNLLLSVLLFAIIGAIMKFCLFYKIMRLGKLSISNLPRIALFLWALGIICLSVRIYYIW